MDALSPDDWLRADDLLGQALAYPPAERTAFLQDACREQPALYQEVVTLLDSAPDAEDRFGDSAAAFAGPLLAAGDPAEVVVPGDTVGPYRVEAEVGRGGMGVVYRASRADGTFEKEVALKLVKRGMDTDEVLARFRRERQLLATLDHPGIARLLDGGAAADGRPYLVMEFVEGEPVTDHAEQRRLPVEERLALFEQVCEAVQHAHRHLVVHRDLKPANILVTEGEDGRPQAKLLDFGIAKLLEVEPGAGVTQEGLRRLTPAYAAPEQLRGDAVTTAADVYALGVVLYELLTGERPSHPPKPPSAVAGSERARALRGDLDQVVLKALREETTARYGSVEALLDDLQRHQTGRPVEARPASAGYRVRKFAKRHRIGVASAAAFVLLLVGAVAALAVQQRATARERDRAEEVTRFLGDLFASNVPTTAPTDTMTVRTLLAEGEARAEALSEQPAVQAYMLRVLGEAWLGLGRYDRAEPLLDRAVALSEISLGPRSPEVADALGARALLAFQTGAYDAANALFQRALGLYRDHHGPAHETVAETVADLATVASEQGAYPAADSLFRETLALYQRLGTEGRPEAVECLRDWAALRFRMGDYAAADSLYGQALGKLEALHGPQHPDIALTLDNLSVLRSRQGNLAAALDLSREALAMRQHLLGDDHPSALASKTNLASFLDQSGDPEAAAVLLRDVIAAGQDRFGEGHPSLAPALSNLATLLGRQRRYGEAEVRYREVIAIQRRTLGEGHPSLANSVSGLASVLRETGQYAEAERLYREAIAVRRAALGAEHPSVASSLSGLGRLKHLTGDLDAAAAHYDEVLRIRRSVLGDRHPDVAFSQVRLADLLREQRYVERAEALYRDALDIYRETLGSDHPRAQQARAGLDALYER
ncbi:MAG: serine/threonine-protein kinase [Bacteroidota bacterium]